ncbi:MAG: apolipoprotein N-acyltransferase [Pyrinomonadaceae bacterium]|nr:apolipoprotein N-acyltransferase [Pyrinomonadaceae bacterium]
MATVEASKSLTNSNQSKFNKIRRAFFAFPQPKDWGLAFLTAILLILAFPDFELSFLAWFAFLPLLLAVWRNRYSVTKSFYLGLLGGTAFFYGSCYWLTNAPIVYGGLPSVLVYLLLVPACVGAGIFTGIFTAILAKWFSRFGAHAIFAAPFLWAGCEWLRLLITGNAWNALGYAQAFDTNSIQLASYGGVFLISFFVILANAAICFPLILRNRYSLKILAVFFFLFIGIYFTSIYNKRVAAFDERPEAVVIALQPNVPMSGLTSSDYLKLRRKHVEMAENGLREVDKNESLKDLPRIVVFPESPMNFAYAYDDEFRDWTRDFTRRAKVSLIFNSAEPDLTDANGYHNSAVMINSNGEKIAQYDKIRLVPFGEFVPEWIPFNELLPTVVGRAKAGKDFRLMPLGDVRAGTMICYESAFGDISNSFTRNGADVLIELTNDGYGGDTPILRQHLANAVFRAVETNRPVVRVTNIGISAYINERGDVSDATKSFTTDTRIWTIAKSDGRQTFYVKYGDVFAFVCTIFSLVLLVFSFWKVEKVK